MKSTEEIKELILNGYGIEVKSIGVVHTLDPSGMEIWERGKLVNKRGDLPKVLVYEAESQDGKFVLVESGQDVSKDEEIIQFIMDVVEGANDLQIVEPISQTQNIYLFKVKKL